MRKEKLIIVYLILLLTSCDSVSKKEIEEQSKSINKLLRDNKLAWKFQAVEKYSYPESNRKLRSPFELNENYSKVGNGNLLQSMKDLKFVGALKNEDSIWALIRKSDGEIMHFKPGEYIDKGHMKIIDIKMKSLVLEEQIFEKGEWRAKQFEVF
ncbi:MULTISPECIES: pilus assembly protein PilP [unclassified Legionella]|uniref:pilus assembly protein PilP n=1 Tax=unclassified Legionella TaxID=2622702 RepID=UPI0010563327|nr:MULTISPECIES: pilus assembly protein PilP [unclassified Legionella]MDI9817713.1 pilus assembly protein PilP [Legionella sp. PL877]